MCMLHATPSRAYQAIVAPTPSQHNPHKRFQSTHLRSMLRLEVTGGDYDDATIWHPAFRELLAFASVHMGMLQRLSSAMTQGNYDYPACDVIEGIADLFGCPDKNGFTPSFQSDFTQTHIQQTKYLHHAGYVICWAWMLRDKLPLTAELLAPVFAAQAEFIAKHTQREYLNLLLGTLRGKREDITHRLNIGNQKGFNLQDIYTLLEIGYSLSECRDYMAKPAAPAPVRRTWREAWPSWQKDLSSSVLQDIGEANRILAKLPTHRNVGYRAKVMARMVKRLLQTNHVASARILLWLWPQAEDTKVETPQQSTRQLLEHAHQVDILIKSLRSKIGHSSAAPAESLIAQAEALLGQDKPIRLLAA